MKHNRHLALALLSAVLVPAGASAQSTRIQFDNTLNDGSKIQVPILDGSHIQFDPNGNLIADCELETGTTVCKGMSVGGTSGAAPTLTLTANPTTIEQGQTTRVTWATGNTPQVCVPTASPGLTAWTGTSADVKLKAVAGGFQDLTLSTVGTQNLSLRCWNEGGASQLRSVAVVVEQSETPPPTTSCSPTAAMLSDPWFRPSGYAERIVNWNNAFNNTPFFTPTTYLHPIGSRTINNGSVGSNYISIPFVPQAGENYKLDWAEAQVVALVGYYSARPAHSAFVTVSKCSGDFRKENNTSTDDSLKRGCRRAGQKNNISFRTDISASTTSNCRVEVGTQYYVNILFADPTAPTPTVSCETGSLCEANFQPTAN